MCVCRARCCSRTALKVAMFRHGSCRISRQRACCLPSECTGRRWRVVPARLKPAPRRDLRGALDCGCIKRHVCCWRHFDDAADLTCSARAASSADLNFNDTSVYLAADGNSVIFTSSTGRRVRDVQRLCARALGRCAVCSGSRSERGVLMRRSRGFLRLPRRTCCRPCLLTQLLVCVACRWGWW